jgi:hypothetical protein
LDQLVSLEDDIWGNYQTKSLRSLEVDDQLELHGLLDGQIGRLRALQDSVHIYSAS